jgi:hypothetical protein
MEAKMKHPCFEFSRVKAFCPTSRPHQNDCRAGEWLGRADAIQAGSFLYYHMRNFHFNTLGVKALYFSNNYLFPNWKCFAPLRFLQDDKVFQRVILRE